MTNEEAIKGLVTLTWNQTGVGGDYQRQCVAMAIDALEKADKYRWHDLRNNPTDLPEYDAQNPKLVLLLHKDGTPYGGWLMKGNTGVWNDDGWWSIHEDIVAWKYIEPFEEEK